MDATTGAPRHDGDRVVLRGRRRVRLIGAWAGLVVALLLVIGSVFSGQAGAAAGLLLLAAVLLLISGVAAYTERRRPRLVLDRDGLQLISPRERLALAWPEVAGLAVMGPHSTGANTGLRLVARLAANASADTVSRLEHTYRGDYGGYVLVILGVVGTDADGLARALRQVNGPRLASGG